MLFPLLIVLPWAAACGLGIAYWSLRRRHQRALAERRAADTALDSAHVTLTRERELARATERANRMDSLGMMAGTIAHDFNNLLAAIIAHISMASLAADDPAFVKQHLEEAERVAWRGHDLIEQIKQFARGEDPKKKLLQLPPLLREAIGAAVLGKPVTVHCDIPDDLFRVMADETQLHQVVNNLAVNAVQAMPEGGDLTVTAANQGRVVRIALGDTGVGIPPENLPRIFQPYFTTKAAGTGLGLASCYSIVTKHGGELRVRSKVGEGTTFEITLPAAGAEDGEPPDYIPASSRTALSTTGQAALDGDRYSK